MSKIGLTLMTLVVSLWSYSEAKVVPPEIVYSPDGTLLAVTRSHPELDGIQLYDAKSLAEIAFLEGDSGKMAFNPNGRILAADGYPGVVFWNVGTRSELAAMESGPIYGVAFSPNGGTFVASAPSGRIHLWDTAQQREKGILDGHNETLVTAVAFSPDGQILASGGRDKTVHLWDVEQQRNVIILEAEDWVNGVAFSPDGQTLASANQDGTVNLWAVTQWQSAAVLRGHTSSVTSVAFSPDGARLITSSRNDQTIRIWDVSTRTQEAIWDSKQGLYSAALSPDGKTVASVGSREVSGWDEDGQYYYSVTIEVKLWDLEAATAVPHTTWGRAKRKFHKRPQSSAISGGRFRSVPSYTSQR